MSYIIHENVMLMADGYIDQAITLLQAPAMDEDKVHGLRVAMKQLRGLVRLYRKVAARSGQGEVVGQINGALRDIAAAFASQRDVHVLADTLELVASRSDKTVARSLRAIRSEIQAQTVDVLPDLAAETLIEQLEWVRDTWGKGLRGNDAELLDALVRVYGKNRQEGWRALNDRDPHRLHEWRKRVKYFYYQLCAWPGTSDWRVGQLERLRKLGSLLGKVHDLDVLKSFLETIPEMDPALLRQVHKRRVRMVKKIRRLYDRTLVQPKKDFRRKMQIS